MSSRFFTARSTGGKSTAVFILLEEKINLDSGDYRHQDSNESRLRSLEYLRKRNTYQSFMKHEYRRSNYNETI